jgi:hypothetical protein
VELTHVLARAVGLMRHGAEKLLATTRNTPIVFAGNATADVASFQAAQNTTISSLNQLMDDLGTLDVVSVRLQGVVTTDVEDLKASVDRQSGLLAVSEAKVRSLQKDKEDLQIMVRDEMSLAEDCSRSLREAMQVKQNDLDQVANLTSVAAGLRAEVDHLKDKEKFNEEAGVEGVASEAEGVALSLQNEVNTLKQDEQHFETKYKDAVLEVQQLTIELHKSLNSEANLRDELRAAQLEKDKIEADETDGVEELSKATVEEQDSTKVIKGLKDANAKLKVNYNANVQEVASLRHSLEESRRARGTLQGVDKVHLKQISSLKHSLEAATRDKTTLLEGMRSLMHENGEMKADPRCNAAHSHLLHDEAPSGMRIQDTSSHSSSPAQTVPATRARKHAPIVTAPSDGTDWSQKVQALKETIAGNYQAGQNITATRTVPDMTLSAESRESSAVREHIMNVEASQPALKPAQASDASVWNHQPINIENVLSRFSAEERGMMTWPWIVQKNESTPTSIPHIEARAAAIKPALGHVDASQKVAARRQEEEETAPLQRPKLMHGNQTTSAKVLSHAAPSPYKIETPGQTDWDRQADRINQYFGHKSLRDKRLGNTVAVPALMPSRSLPEKEKTSDKDAWIRKAKNVENFFHRLASEENDARPLQNLGNIQSFDDAGTLDAETHSEILPQDDMKLAAAGRTAPSDDVSATMSATPHGDPSDPLWNPRADEFKRFVREHYMNVHAIEASQARIPVQKPLTVDDNAWVRKAKEVERYFQTVNAGSKDSSPSPMHSSDQVTSTHAATLDNVRLAAARSIVPGDGAATATAAAPHSNPSDPLWNPRAEEFKRYFREHYMNVPAIEASQASLPVQKPLTTDDDEWLRKAKDVEGYFHRLRTHKKDSMPSPLHDSDHPKSEHGPTLGDVRLAAADSIMPGDNAVTTTSAAPHSDPSDPLWNPRADELKRFFREQYMNVPAIEASQASQASRPVQKTLTTDDDAWLRKAKEVEGYFHRVGADDKGSTTSPTQNADTLKTSHAAMPDALRPTTADNIMPGDDAVTATTAAPHSDPSDPLWNPRAEEFKRYFGETVMNVKEASAPASTTSTLVQKMPLNEAAWTHKAKELENDLNHLRDEKWQGEQITLIHASTSAAEKTHPSEEAQSQQAQPTEKQPRLRGSSKAAPMASIGATSQTSVDYSDEHFVQKDVQDAGDLFSQAEDLIADVVDSS